MLCTLILCSSPFLVTDTNQSQNVNGIYTRRTIIGKVNDVNRADNSGLQDGFFVPGRQLPVQRGELSLELDATSVFYILVNEL